MPDITYDVGRVSFVMKGAWNLATAYEKLDAVTYDGSLYIAKQDVPGGTSITNTTYWQLAAEKGDKGDTGGVDSVNGQQGDVWFPDSRQLISDGYTTDTDPFITKGNDSDSDRFELKKLGNTVCVNDLHNGSTKTKQGITATWNSTTQTYTLSGTSESIYAEIFGAIPLIENRKYLAFGVIKKNPNNVSFEIGILAGATPIASSGQYKTYTANATANKFAGITGFTAGTDLTGIEIEFHAPDLSLWFGSTANIPSDLLSHPENWGRYYAGSLAYAAGYLDSADGTVLKSIGRNVWDEEWEVGGINLSTGQNVWADNKIRSTNYIPVIPNTAYYAKAKLTNGGLFYGADKTFLGQNYVAYPNNTTFTTPPNAYYMRFVVSDTYGTTYNHDITISLYYPGESGYDQYYPYTVLAEVDTGSEVLRSAGAVADEKTPDGTITRNISIRNFATDVFTLTKVSSDASNYSYYVSANNLTGDFSIRSNRFVCASSPNASLLQGGEMVGSSSYKVVYLNFAGLIGTNDVATAKQWMIDHAVVLYYAATPTTEQGTAFEPLVVTVKNGVLSWTNTKGIPVGHESHYFENLRKRVEDRLPDPPSADGTYRLTCTISGGVKTYSWEA